MIGRQPVRILLLVALGLLAIAAAGAWRVEGGLARAEQMAKFGLWSEVRTELSRYLWLHPQREEALLAMAEAYYNDEELPAADATVAARSYLVQVPDDSRFAAMARSMEGRMELFVLNRPQRAEQLFEQALTVNSRAIDPHFMIWKLYDMTGRSHLSEDHFWQVYEVTPQAGRGSRLREWYMSQFFPATANPTLDQLMAVANPRDPNAARTEGDRFVRFRNSEPDRSIGYAALARWFQHEGDAQFAQQVLDEGLEKAVEPGRDPFFVSTQVSIAIALGEFDGLRELIEEWPEPKTGYEYWVTRGNYSQEVEGDFAAAVESYDEALKYWPGQVDWRTLNRKASCLARLKRDADLARLRERIKVVESLTDNKLHVSLRAALGAIDDPEKLQALQDFYERLERPREAAGWREYIAWLRTPEAQAARSAAETAPSTDTRGGKP
ncbi:MAG: tetratricopeptide repeat protein [Planctomycetota bacterium]